MDATTAPGSYVVVARRYRPQQFEELVGQEHVARALGNAITSGRVGHAYLFTGARGVGKTSSARILAKCLNCQRGPSPQPCNQCDICLAITAGSDVDVIEIDGASNRGIDEIRQLRQNVGVRPSRSRYKIYIIDEVHMLTKEAFNALLKTLEEPPEHVKFIFCTTEPEKLPITVLSRCQRFDFAGIESASIQQRLAQIAAAEGVEAEPEALAILARRAAGSMRDSQSLLEQILAFGGQKITEADVHRLLGTAATGRLTALLQAVLDRDPAAALRALDAALAEGVDVGQLIDQLVGSFRDVMIAAAGCSSEQFLYSSPSEASLIVDVARRLGLETVLAMLQILDQALARMRVSIHRRTLAETALARICRLEQLADLGGMIEQLRAGGAATGSGTAPSGSRASGATSAARASATSAAPTQTAGPAGPSSPADGGSSAGASAEEAGKKNETPVASTPEDRSPGRADGRRDGLPATPPPSSSSAPGALSNGAASDAPPASPARSPSSATAVEPNRRSPASDAAEPFDEDSDAAFEPDAAALAAALSGDGDEDSAERSSPPQRSLSVAPFSAATSRDESRAATSAAAPPLSTSSADAAPHGDARQVWETAIEALSPMLRGAAGRHCEATWMGADSLRITFATRDSAARSYCEQVESYRQIETAVASAAGRRVRVEFEVSADATPPAPRKSLAETANSRRDRMRQALENPLVQRATEVLSAKVLGIDEPRGS